MFDKNEPENILTKKVNTSRYSKLETVYFLLPLSIYCIAQKIFLFDIFEALFAYVHVQGFLKKKRSHDNANDKRSWIQLIGSSFFLQS